MKKVFLSFLLVLILIAQSVHADNREVVIPITMTVPEDATGSFLLMGNSLTELSGQIINNHLVGSLPAEAIAKSSTMVGIINFPDGTKKYTPVFARMHAIQYSVIGNCPNEAKQQGFIQQSDLVSLYELRTQLEKGLRKEVDNLLQPKMELLKKLEKGFGFNFEKELNAELPAEELVVRLEGLLQAVREYRKQRG